jgi:hypothetical protein
MNDIWLDGGIGRRNGLKIRYPYGCKGSSPFPATFAVKGEK